MTSSFTMEGTRHWILSDSTDEAGVKTSVLPCLGLNPVKGIKVVGKQKRADQGIRPKEQFLTACAHTSGRSPVKALVMD